GGRGRLWERIATCHSLRWLAFQVSPSVQSAIPRRARSLMRNCPGDPERAGKPPALDAQTPGVVTRKLRVVRNIPTATALPRGEPGGQRGGGARRGAVATPAPPGTAENPGPLMTPKPHLIGGLGAPNGLPPPAS